MKKISTILLLTVIMLSVLTGCGKIEKNAENGSIKQLEGMGFTVIEHFGKTAKYDYYIVYDNDTKVVYFLSHTSRGYALCPRYDENGEIMIYEGE